MSRKIVDDEERRRLKTLLKEVRQERGGGGFIARTAGRGAQRRGLRARRALPQAHLGRGPRPRRRASARPRSCTASWASCSACCATCSPTTSPPSAWTTSASTSARWTWWRELQPELAARVRLCAPAASILEEHGVTGGAGAGAALQGLARPPAATSSSTRPRPWWRSTSTRGRYTGKKNLEETILKINLEAVREIVRQIRLRDLGGIIVVDFIDMEERKSRAEGDGGAGAGAAPGPLAFEGPFRERVRPRDPDPQARAAVAGAHAVRAVPLLHGERDDQDASPPCARRSTTR